MSAKSAMDGDAPRATTRLAERQSSGKKRRRAILFSGGGFRVLSFCGLRRVIDFSGVDVVGGVSAGGIVGVFTVLDLGEAAMRNVVEKLSVAEFLVRWSDFASFLPRVAVLEKARFFEVVDQFLVMVGLDPSVTFLQLRELTKKTLRLFACSLRGGELTTFDADTHPDLEVRIGLCAGMAVPFVVEPVKIGQDLFFDAGAVNNLPVALMGDPEELMAFNSRPSSPSQDTIAGRLTIAGFVRMNFYLAAGVAACNGKLFLLDVPDGAGKHRHRHMLSARDFDASVRAGASAVVARIMAFQIMGLFSLFVAVGPRAVEPLLKDVPCSNCSAVGDVASNDGRRIPEGNTSAAIVELDRTSSSSSSSPSSSSTPSSTAVPSGTCARRQLHRDDQVRR